MSSAHHSLLHEGCTQQLLMASSISCQKHENGVNAINRILRCSAERSLRKTAHTKDVLQPVGLLGHCPSFHHKAWEVQNWGLLLIFESWSFTGAPCYRNPYRTLGFLEKSMLEVFICSLRSILQHDFVKTYWLGPFVGDYHMSVSVSFPGAIWGPINFCVEMGYMFGFHYFWILAVQGDWMGTSLLRV